MAFDIIDDIPLPARERTRKYNIDELEVGQGLIIPKDEPHSESSIYTAARKLGYSVSIRVMPEDDPDERWSAGDTAVVRVETRAPRTKKAPKKAA